MQRKRQRILHWRLVSNQNCGPVVIQHPIIAFPRLAKGPRLQEVKRSDSTSYRRIDLSGGASQRRLGHPHRPQNSWPQS
jgi:hypothetical protein